MALALGTNSGFVTVAPTADPAEAGTTTIDSVGLVTRHVSPANSVRITEVGWWRNAGTDPANWEIGLYSESGGVADALLFVDATNSTTSTGWQVVAVDWAISGSTAYWLGLQMDAHAGASNIDTVTTGGQGYDTRAGQTTLNDPFGGGSVLQPNGMAAIYALVEIGSASTSGNLLLLGVG